MSAAVAVIQFILDMSDGTELDFLRLWNEGEFDTCRKEWPEAPEACYIGADPLLPVAENPHRFVEVWPLAQEDAARKQFETLASDSYGFKRSRKGTYVNGSTARDWKWFRLGMRAAT